MASTFRERQEAEDAAVVHYNRSRTRARGRVKAAGETGGPGESYLVQEEDISETPEIYPTDLIIEEEGVREIKPIGGAELVDSRKLLTGWSIGRQRLFLETLAETGSVHTAAGEAQLSARGAYRLRARSPAFARAWDAAQQVAVGRLSALAFDRAIHGRLEQVYKDGALVAERRVPSDRMLTWLLARLDPQRFALPWERHRDAAADPQGQALADLPDCLDALTDLATTPYDEHATPALAAPLPGTPSAARAWGLHECPPALPAPAEGASSAGT